MAEERLFESPSPPYPFIGRQRELEWLRERVGPRRARTPDDAKAFMFRMAAEAAECCGKPDFALWFACLYSHMFHFSHAYKSQETQEQRSADTR